jgi:hypothetical protein
VLGQLVFSFEPVAGDAARTILNNAVVASVFVVNHDVGASRSVPLVLRERLCHAVKDLL